MTGRMLVIVPTYMERDNIATVVERLFADPPDGTELLVIDDASPDGTADVVAELARGDERVHLMARSGKLGLGSAYIAGFRWGIARGFDLLVEMDADLSHDPADVARLGDALAHADLAIGSRYVMGGRVENWSSFRRALSRSGNAYARLWLRLNVRDATSGYRAYRRSVLEMLDLDSIRSEGYAFQIEMAYRIHRRGGRIVEVPITFVERTAGASKMSKRIVLEALARVPLWALRARLTGGDGSSRRRGR